MGQLIPMFALGLVTSLHCIMMCGGLVLTCAVRGSIEGPWYRRAVPHVAYQAAKLVSYAAVAVVLGSIVAVVGGVDAFSGARNWLPLVGGAYMVLLGLSMTKPFAFLRRLTPRPPKRLVQALTKNRRRAIAEEASGEPTLVTPMVLGALTGFLPCTPLIAAQMSAASTGSPLTAAVLMIAFGLGTAPLMLAFGIGSSLITGAFERRLQIVSALAVVIFGLVIFDRGLVLVKSPVSSSTVISAVGRAFATREPSNFTRGADGVVEVSLVIRNTQYEPHDVVIPAGETVRLIVDRQEATPCSNQLQIPSAGLLVDLAPNSVTTVEVPAMKPGTYTMTCGMAMMSGSVVVVRGSK